MLFHLGSVWRLAELGYLPKLSRVSSVSGGSITAAVLGRLGLIPNPAVGSAVAVAASSAFPPVLSPLRIEFPEGAWTSSRLQTEDLHRERF
jgi:hypothetical protein